MPRTLEDVLAIRDIGSPMMQGMMKEVEELLEHNSHMCYNMPELLVAVKWPREALPLPFVLFHMVDKVFWRIDSPVKGWYRFKEGGEEK